MEKKMTREDSESSINLATFYKNDFYDFEYYINIYRRTCNHLGKSIDECEFCKSLENLFYDEKCDIDNDIILFDLSGKGDTKKYCEIRRVDSAYHDSTLAFTFRNIMECIRPLITKDSYDTRKGIAPLK